MESTPLTSASTMNLSDGNSIPLFGLGCWAMKGEESKNAVLQALKQGYRLIDTAYMYDNESEVGAALQESGVPREEVFVVTKLNTGEHGYEGARKSLEGSLARLGLSYVDLLLIHTPTPGRILETWKAMCEMKKEGLTKSIGVSNFNVQHLQPLLDSSTERPVVNQFEFHPWLQQQGAVAFCQQNGIQVMGFSPVARAKNFKDGENPELDAISKKYSKSKAQILLRWAIQRGIVTIPKSANAGRIRENVDLYDFQLSPEEILTLNGFENQNGGSVTTVTGKSMTSEWTG